MVEAAAKIKKKKWFTILAPRTLGERPIGEIYLVDVNSLVGKVIPCNLMVITNDIKHQNINMKFEVKGISENKALTEQIYYELNPSMIKRLMRRNKDRIDESFAVKTSDGVNVRVKLFALTNSKTKGSVLKKLRKALREITMDIVSKNKFNDVFDGIIRRKLQKDVSDGVKKIFPVKVCEVRMIKKEAERLEQEKKKGAKKTKEIVEEIEENVEEKTEEKTEKTEEPEIVEEEKPKKKAARKKKEKENAETSN